MEPVTLFLAGDVMTGRGVDQALPSPGDPQLWESFVGDASGYVTLAEEAHGAIPRPMPMNWPWGDAVALLDEVAPEARIANLETAVTARGRPEPGKAVHYRMNPANLGVLTVARLDVCTLANNHLLDFGPEGLRDTVDHVTAAGIGTSGAGSTLERARRPAAVSLASGARVVVVSCADASSGVPRQWAAGPDRLGVHLLPDLSGATADDLVAGLAEHTRPGDVRVVSVHWGANWGYRVPRNQIAFARRLVDAGVDVVHGHSSHHPRRIEIYRGKLILYGCGDLINDYEGITGHEQYRSDLRLAYLPSIDPATGRLTRLRLLPLRSRRFRLDFADETDIGWLRSLLADLCHRTVRAGGERLLEFVV